MKRFATALIGIITIFTLASCTKTAQAISEKIEEMLSSADIDNGSENDNEKSAIQLDESAVYTNSYLGVSYTIPKGWWLYEINDINFNDDKEKTGDTMNLDINYNDDYTYIELCHFANLQFSKHDNHLGFDLGAESAEGRNSFSSYMEYFEEWMLEPVDDYTYELVNSDQISINSVKCEKRTFKAHSETSDFNLLTLTLPVQNGFYLTFSADYWPDNRNAEKNIINAVSRGLKIEL
jgi:hypothetical protein